MEHDHGTVAFFQAMAPVLIANVLTVAFVYCFAKVHQKEPEGVEQGRFTYLRLIVLVFLFMLYGLYTGVSILQTNNRLPDPEAVPSPPGPAFS
jgi:hypothetical protein